jgi:hypothetical protein
MIEKKNHFETTIYRVEGERKKKVKEAIKNQ